MLVPLEVEVCLACLDQIEEALPAVCRFTEKGEDRPHLVVFLNIDDDATPLKLIGRVNADHSLQ